jgi:hypothetical protein
MANIAVGAQKDHSGTIMRDRWVPNVPGRRRTPVEDRKFKVAIEPAKSTTDVKAALQGMRVYWTPGRSPDPATVSPRAVAAMRLKLHQFDRELRLAWNPKERLWGVWVVAPQIQTDWCKGWKLLFLVKPEFLDDRVMSKLYESDTTRFGGAKKVYEAFIASIATKQAKTEDSMRQEARDWAGDYFDHTRIQVGYGKSSGSKFAKHG